jgi:hypothetical protein
VQARKSHGQVSRASIAGPAMPSQGQAPVKSLRCISMRCWAVLIVAASRIRAVTSPSLPPGALFRGFGPGAHAPPHCFAINGLPAAEVAGALSRLGFRSPRRPG